ncbi:hypothetical protein Prudu_017582 [Prunus dulcis]|uniref:F-box family protein with DUF295 n=1 Tax=Prunus dulcis TaxID=3755 RepID=A0A4Y1RQA2_PRUDU|nr:hypothetical protein Prudu_017582 [Prunus dulcis]
MISALDLPHEFRGRSDRECQDLRLGRLGVPRPARIAARLTLCPRDLPGFADQADYGPLHPARATRVDLVSSRNLPAGQNSYVGPLTSSNCFHPQAVDVCGIHHRATHNLSASSQIVEVRRIHHRAIPSFRATKGDSAEFSTEV